MSDGPSVIPANGEFVAITKDGRYLPIIGWVYQGYSAIHPITLTQEPGRGGYGPPEVLTGDYHVQAPPLAPR